jgi:dolichol-phosphate mannosyltransferase
MKDKILVAIPMYNCEKQIARVISQFDQEMTEFITEVLIIDNGSKDNGLEAAKTNLVKLTNLKVTLFQNCDNYSLGGTHKVAFNYAINNAFDYCVILHGDDQGSIHDLLPHLKSGEYRDYDCFLGARFHKDSKLEGYFWFRTFGNIVVNFLCSVACGHWVEDMGSGLNVFSTKYLSNKFYLYFPNDLTYNVYLLLYAVYSKAKFKFFPLLWREDDQVSNARMFKQGFQILGLLGQYLLNAKEIFSTEDNEYSVIDYQSNTIYSH